MVESAQGSSPTSTKTESLPPLLVLAWRYESVDQKHHAQRIFKLHAHFTDRWHLRMNPPPPFIPRL